jgi:four helix bundle protein
MEKPHRRLKAWQVGMEIAIDIYKTTEGFPSEEKYGLTSQMRRCGISIPSNVAEGAARKSKKEFVNFLHISQGSLSELDTQLELARRLEFIDEETWKDLDKKLLEEDKILSGLIRSQKDATQ